MMSPFARLAGRSRFQVFLSRSTRFSSSFFFIFGLFRLPAALSYLSPGVSESVDGRPFLFFRRDFPSSQQQVIGDCPD